MPTIGAVASNPAVPPSWFNVKDYGAVGDNGNDDTAAIQAAVNALKARTVAATGEAGGQTLYFPQGFYRTTSSLNFQGLGQVRIVGAGDGRGGWRLPGSPGVCINYTGGGTAHVVDMRGSQGCVWDGVSIWTNTGAAHSGVLLNLDALTAGDIFGHRIQNCQLRALNSTAGTYLTSMAGNIEVSFDNVHFMDCSAGTQVRMVNPAAPATWSNANSFRSCSFAGDRVTSVLNPGPQTTFIDCTFEYGAGHLPAPILYNVLGNEPAELLNLVGCGFWDVTGTGAGASWIKSTVATRAFSFTGTRFGISPNGYAIDLSNHEGLFIGGCRFGSDNGGTTSVFKPAQNITNGAMLGSVVSNGTSDNHAAVFV